MIELVLGQFLIIESNQNKIKIIKEIKILNGLPSTKEKKHPWDELYEWIENDHLYKHLTKNNYEKFVCINQESNNEWQLMTWYYDIYYLKFFKCRISSVKNLPFEIYEWAKESPTIGKAVKNYRKKVRG